MATLFDDKDKVFVICKNFYVLIIICLYSLESSRLNALCREIVALRAHKVVKTVEDAA